MRKQITVIAQVSRLIAAVLQQGGGSCGGEGAARPVPPLQRRAITARAPYRTLIRRGISLSLSLPLSPCERKVVEVVDLSVECGEVATLGDRWERRLQSVAQRRRRRRRRRRRPCRRFTRSLKRKIKNQTFSSR